MARKSLPDDRKLSDYEDLPDPLRCTALDTSCAVIFQWEPRRVGYRGNLTAWFFISKFLGGKCFYGKVL